MASAAAVTFSGKASLLVSSFGRDGSSSATQGWLSGALALPAAGLNKIFSLSSMIWIRFEYAFKYLCACIYMVF